MPTLSPMERVSQLVGLLDLNPTLEQIADFLSKSIDPTGEICGIAIHELDSYGMVGCQYAVGFKISLDLSVPFPISNDNPACYALLTGDIQIVDITPQGIDYKDMPQMDRLIDYQTGVALPFTHESVMGIALESNINEMELHREYFDVIRSILASYVVRKRFEVKKESYLHTRLSDKGLTSRQKSIVEMIKEGRTNNSIASILGYSESLIRQETIIIYRKLGVEGRKNLLKKSNLEEVSE